MNTFENPPGESPEDAVSRDLRERADELKAQWARERFQKAIAFLIVAPFFAFVFLYLLAGLVVPVIALLTISLVCTAALLIGKIVLNMFSRTGGQP
jgi:hypothetical protein